MSFPRKLMMGLLILVSVFCVKTAVFAPSLKQVHWVDGFIRGIWIKAEQRGLIKPYPAYKLDYYDDFPAFRLLEENYKVIREEALALIDNNHDNIPRLKDLVSEKRATSLVYKVDWKVFWFRMGLDIKGNCDRAPHTYKLLKKIPNLYNAFFSVLEPGVHIDPHWGHYKGFLRYHLGLVVPNNNTDHKIFLRIRPDIEKNRSLPMEEREVLLNQGTRYYWHEGEGVMFDDNPLHDATNNNTDSLRIVLFLDVERKMPWYLTVFNRICLFVANHNDPIKSMRRNALLDEAKELSKPEKFRQML